MVSTKEILNLFIPTESKIILLIIIYFSCLSVILLIPFKKKRRIPKGTIFKKEKESIIVRESKYITSGVCFAIAISFFVYAYLSPQTPSFDHTATIIAGNDSRNISELDKDRLEYLSDNFVIVKKSVQSMPSRFDIDNSNPDDNEDYFRTHNVKPFWDVSINSDNDWTWYNIELYFINNGIGPAGTKHSHDFEAFQIYFHKNETTPKYIVFPLFDGFVSHPKEYLKWSLVPRFNDKYTLLLDSETNAFSEDYDNFPKKISSYKPVFVTPKQNTWNYLTKIEKIQVVLSTVFLGVFSILLFTTELYHHAYSVIFIFLLISALYPFITLQYDYIETPSFRVFYDGNKPDLSGWYTSEGDAKTYADTYGLPYDRSRWTEPYYFSLVTS